jgi:hypothetical protein
MSSPWPTSNHRNPLKTLAKYRSPSLPINSAKWLHWYHMQPTCQLANMRLKRGQLATSRRHGPYQPQFADPGLALLFDDPIPPVFLPNGAQKQTTNDFYTPVGYILPLNSFVIRRSSPKSSTNFVDFCRFYASKPSLLDPRPDLRPPLRNPLPVSGSHDTLSGQTKQILPRPKACQEGEPEYLLELPYFSWV